MASENTPLVKDKLGDSTAKAQAPLLYVVQDGDDEVSSVENVPGAETGEPTPNYGAEDEVLPLLHRSKTFSASLNPNRDMALPISVSNPLSMERRLSMIPCNSYEQLCDRFDSLQLLRPFRLIGRAGRLIDWEKYRVSDADLDAIPKRRLRNFYGEQNDMIDRYQDIDLLLATGVQIEMIQNYADNTSTDTGSDSEELETTAPKSPLTVPAKAKKMKRGTAGGSHGSSGRRHMDMSAAPGNIDLEGARILAPGHGSQSSVVLYAIYFNFLVNVVLLVGKVFAVYLSGSLSLVASLVDSALDFLSTMIIFVANRYAMKQSAKFPVGRKQLEPIGVLIFSIFMILSFLQVLIESVKQLLGAGGAAGGDLELSAVAVAIMLGTIVVKCGAYVICKNIRNSSIQALVEDAKTDIVFNAFSLVFPVLGVYFRLGWVDALGASVLCLYVIFQWLLIVFEHIDHLSGSHASKGEYQQVLYLIMRFTDEILKVKNYRMYHLGDLVNVEVDIVLRDSAMSLKDCHDLGESLQYAIETLPYVNRCFVHLDYKVRNYLGHLS